MDKIAMYKEEIEKQASRAWKRNFSEGIRKELVSKGILDYGKELNGLNKGTDNIIKHHKGIGGYFSPDQAKEKLIDDIKNTKMLQKSVGLSGASLEQIGDDFKQNIKNTNGFITYTGNKHRVVVKGKLQKGNDIDTLMGGIPRRKLHQKYLEGIMNRHEANELSYGANSFKSNKNSIPVIDSRIAHGTFSSHMSPKVLGAESANAAIAPKIVKDKLTKVRTDIGEKDYLKNRFGFEYGDSGKYNKNINAKMQRGMAAQNRPYLKEFKKQIEND